MGVAEGFIKASPRVTSDNAWRQELQTYQLYNEISLYN